MAARRVGGWAAALAPVALAGAPGLTVLASSAAALRADASRGAGAATSHHRLCGPPAAGMAACQGELATDPSGRVATAAAPAGHGADDLQSAYNLPSSTNGAGQTVAIVDAYDDPNAEADQSAYRAQYGLAACTSASGCFRKVDQSGGTAFPAADAGWAGEISLDLDMVAAVCPLCHVLLVEASTPSLKNLGTGVDTAAALGATEISNSYARGEFKGEKALDVHYNHPGIMITVASGNGSYTQGATYPAASPYVTAVGGTKLNRTPTARGWTETVWSKSSSGCSLYEPKPAWQHDSGCAGRTVADTAAVAVNLAVYDTWNQPGWVTAYGTSAPTPIIAAAYALAGNAATLTYGSSTYRSGASLFDVTTGSTGSCGTYLCTGVPGYDGPTGNGTPDGVSAY